MKKLIYTFAFLLLIPVRGLAEDRIERSWNPHELRIGWGDQLFETLAWREERGVPTGLSADFTRSASENYRYTQHVFAEYQYRFNSWFGLGAMIDGSSVYWDKVLRNGAGAELAREKNCHFYNVVIMPTVRFTYFHHEYVDIYSGLGAGLNINGGTETDIFGRHTVCAPVVDIRLLGFGFNYQRYFVNLDFGGMYSLQNMNTVFMLKSRMFTASIGARF